MTITKSLTMALLGALILLSGCASQTCPPLNTVVLKPNWLPAQQLQIDLDGRRYSGEWHSQTCHTDACRDVFRNVKRHERGHVARGEAQLTSHEGARLDCEWTSFRAQLEGVCRTPDGGLYPLRQSE